MTPHPKFGRSGDDLTVTVPVSFADAALGADIDVPTLNGAPVTLRVKPGTQPGSRHRVKDKGIERTTKSGTTKRSSHRDRRRRGAVGTERGTACGGRSLRCSVYGGVVRRCGRESIVTSNG